MAAPVGFLLLWGLTLGSVSEAATVFETQPNLWVESASPLEPWAQLMLTCRACLETQDFQLFKNGVALEPVRLDNPAIAHQFVLGDVTRDNRGLYHCRAGLGDRWTRLSDVVEVTGTEPLPPPRLSAEPVSWITPGLNSTLRCRAVRHNVTFLLMREGDHASPSVAEAGEDGEATFPVHRAGNYSCSYRTHAAGGPSEPSDTVTVEELAAPPPPSLAFRGDSARVLRPRERAFLLCVAPMNVADFELQRRGETLWVPMATSSSDRVFFHLAPAEGDAGPYTCRYRPLRGGAAWSVNSAPVELVRSDGSLPAPDLSAHPAGPRAASGSLVRLRCRVPGSGLRVALEREDALGRRLKALLRPAGAEAEFELRDVSVADSANYSCVYTDPAQPFVGSAPSARLELRVDGPPPAPRLRVLGPPVTPGRDAVLRCEGSVPGVLFELLRAGEEEAVVSASSTRAAADLVLIAAGPGHAGNYSCRYRAWGPVAFESQRSDPVELQVSGEVPGLPGCSLGAAGPAASKALSSTDPCRPGGRVVAAVDQAPSFLRVPRRPPPRQLSHQEQAQRLQEAGRSRASPPHRLSSVSACPSRSLHTTDFESCLAPGTLSVTIQFLVLGSQGRRAMVSRRVVIWIRKCTGLSPVWTIAMVLHEVGDVTEGFAALLARVGLQPCVHNQVLRKHLNQILYQHSSLLATLGVLGPHPGLDLSGEHAQELHYHQQLQDLLLGAGLRLQPLLAQLSELG
ncbi:alpha-1B-glycoprotein [Erethizon dorsatum]